MNDKRAWPRIGLRLNVYFKSAPTSHYDGYGTTENVSGGGMLFRTHDWKKIKPGQPIIFRLTGNIPDKPEIAYKNLTGTGRVLRLQLPEPGNMDAQASKVAVSFEKTLRFSV